MFRVAAVMGKMNSGGKKNLVMEYYRHIDRSQVQFDFLCDADSNSIPEDEIAALGGKVYVVAPYQRIGENMKQIAQICRENQYPIIHGYNGTMNVFALRAAKKAGVPIRINESISMAHSGDKKTVLKNILKGFSSCYATNYMANGQMCGIWQFGQKAFDEGRVRIFKSVIDADRNAFDFALREKTREAYGLKDNIVFGHIGRLTAQKNTLFLMDIFHEALKKEPRAKLVIIGYGELEKPMLEKVRDYEMEDNVLYLGRTEDIRRFYNAFDCFLLPSLYEGVPVVGIEAECCGLPMFFSTEISKESSPCQDLGHFLPLSAGPAVWADEILKAIRETERTDHSQAIKAAGFDSVTEAAGLLNYYKELLKANGLEKADYAG